MEGNRASELYELFAQALVLSSEARAQFLAELEDTDPDRARELSALLEADEVEHGVLERELPAKVLVAAIASMRASEDMPSRIGPFFVVRRLGNGGMGDVYLARQETPVRRDVALKVIRTGLASPDLLARFEQERQVLARLEHAHVARIFGAGADERGRPYFVMELVDGEPLIAHCQKRGLDLRARLGLFLELCEAVEHAHRHGVLHRDLKPTNVLVTAGGCKVIDFGVAKLVGPRSDMNLTTASGQFLGTPAYMSPEQAGAEVDIDTRSDVYSLGVLLFELLVDERPYAAELERATSLSGLLRVVREREPARPSSHRPRLSRDLDWIVLRALEKERERRYRSVSELAADVQRFLRHEPIDARPASVGYRLRKLARRRRTAVIGAGATLLSLVGVLAFTSASYVRATQARQRYQESNDHLRRLSDRQLLLEAERAARSLWPIEAARCEDLVRWQRTYAEPLLERRPIHAARLAQLEAQALPSTEEERARDRAEHPRAEELHALKGLIEHFSRPEVQAVTPGWVSYLETYSPRARELENEVAGRRTWRFSSARDQWEHDELVELESELELFFAPDPHSGHAASVAHRLAEAERMDEAERAARVEGAWEAARSEIRASGRYGAFELEPEQGLVPLGPDPHSGLHEFWHVASGERPRVHPEPDSPSRWQLEDATGIVLVLVPGGTYRLGAQRDDPTRAHYDPLARPEEAVSAVELWPFYLSKYELTLAQWERVMGKWPAFSFGPRWPACDVTWNESVEFLRRLGLVLPSEAQWEVAARGGTESPWWCGDTTRSLAGCANIADRTSFSVYGRHPWLFSAEHVDPWYKLAPVDEARANPFGLHHVAGNVIEWCADPYLTQGWGIRAGDGLRLPPAGTAAPGRSARGGGWQRPAESARSAHREPFGSDTRLTYLGLRPARPLDRDRARLVGGPGEGAR